MTKTIAAALLAIIFWVPSAQAQATPSDFSEFKAWVSSQQANAGLASDLHRVKFAALWWDAVSIGEKGLNVGQAGARDFVDLGPYYAVANDKAPRYGLAVPLHVGNIWNALAAKLPSGVQSHVRIVSLPNVTTAAAFLYPRNKPLDRWTWDDFQVAIAYRFGGSAPQAAAP